MTGAIATIDASDFKARCLAVVGDVVSPVVPEERREKDCQRI